MEFWFRAVVEIVRETWLYFAVWGSKGLFYVVNLFAVNVVGFLLEVMDCQVR